MTSSVAAPRVSVCIPARDHARYLETAIASALAQDVDGLEVIVADDASADGTAELVASLRDTRITYLRHASPVGVAANRNACLAAARGEYIAWLDADDERLEASLRSQIELLDRHPEVVLVHGGHAVVDSDGRALPAWPAPFDRDAIESSATAFRQLIASNEIATSTVVVRRSAHDAVGPFTAEIGASSSDWDMWLRLALRGAVAYFAEPIARYRQHANSISRATAASGERLRCNVRVVEHVLGRRPGSVPSDTQADATAYAALAAKALLQAGDAYTSAAIPEARDAITLAGRLWPDAPADELLGTIERADVVAYRDLTRKTLRRLAQRLAGTRFGAKIDQATGADDEWDAVLARAGATVAWVTPPDAVIAAVAKWDPALLTHSSRPGCNFPDRELDPHGYPLDSAAAIAQLQALRASHGITHLVVPAVSAWWLEHYAAFARWLGMPEWRDENCAIFELRGGA